MASDFTSTPAHLVAQAARLFSQAFQARFAPHNVTPAQYPVLLHLWREDGLTQHQLCDLVGIEQPTMANTLKRMERDGLVRKVQDDNDRRKVRIRLTRRAKGLQEALDLSAEEVLSAAVAGFSAMERDGLDALLKRVIANLEQDMDQDLLVLEPEQEAGQSQPEPEPIPEPIPEPVPEPVRTETVIAPPPSSPARQASLLVPEPQLEEAEEPPLDLDPGSLWAEEEYPPREDEPVPDQACAEPQCGPSPEFPYDPDSVDKTERPFRKPSDDESELLILEEVYLAPSADIEQQACLPEDCIKQAMDGTIDKSSEIQNVIDSKDLTDDIMELTDLYEDEDDKLDG